MTASLDALKGSIPPLITPFRNGEVDYDAYAKLVEFQIKNGSHGILVNGTTSEPSTLQNGGTSWWIREHPPMYEYSPIVTRWSNSSSG